MTSDRLQRLCSPLGGPTVPTCLGLSSFSSKSSESQEIPQFHANWDDCHHQGQGMRTGLISLVVVGANAPKGKGQGTDFYAGLPV